MGPNFLLFRLSYEGFDLGAHKIDIKIIDGAMEQCVEVTR